MSGTLPVEWSQLTDMWALGLDPVMGTLGITGTLPSEWGTWSNMALVNIASAPHLEGVCVGGGQCNTNLFKVTKQLTQMMQCWPMSWPLPLAASTSHR